MPTRLPPPMVRAAALLAAVPLLIWPALWNGHPIIFPDSTAYGLHAATGLPPWDKALPYGWWLALLGGGASVWPPVIAQALAVSWLLWLAQRAVRGRAEIGVHLLLALGLALFSTAPWFTGLLMPDILGPVAVLALWLLGFAEARTSRAERLALILLAGFAIATHPTHLAVAAAMVGVALPWRRSWRPALRMALPLGMAIALLLGGNLWERGQASLSPTGPVFLFARLQADGPATRTLQRECPQAGWEMCRALDAFPMHSDRFLWHGESPLNRGPDGAPRHRHGIAFAAEARAINAATLQAEPSAVIGAAVANGMRQLVTLRLGDILDGEHARSFGEEVLRPHFPPDAYARFARSLQRGPGLERLARPFDATQRLALLLSLLLGLVAAWQRWQATTARGASRGPGRWPSPWRTGPAADPRLALLACVAVGVVANAFVCGALSGVYDRYQARITWLLPLVAALSLWPQRAPRTASASSAT
ncbi:MAG: hypothetical protein N3D18_15155 [Roseococcus sp.]|nr:hypothetical protein [Roseococcus sp.]